MLFGTFSFPESLVCAKLRHTRLNNSATDMQYILYMSFPLYALVPPHTHTKKTVPEWIYVEQTLLNCQHARWHFSEELLEWLATKWRGRILVPFRDVGAAIWFSISTVLCADDTFPERTGRRLGVSQASLGYQFRLLRSACNFPCSYLTSLSSSCSVTPPYTSSHLSHFHPISSASPAQLFPPCSLYFPSELPILPSSSLAGKVSACFTRILCVWHFPISLYTCFWLC